MLTKGDHAPDITATTTTGDTISLQDYAGKRNVILYFYPKDDTPGCTKESCEFRDMKSEFDAVETEIFGVSTDDQDSHTAFTSKFNLNFPLLVDQDEAICEAFGVPRTNSMAHRVTFLVGKDGKIAEVWEAVNPVGHSSEVMEAVRNLNN